jgi:hypothetical protein
MVLTCSLCADRQHLRKVHVTPSCRVPRWSPVDLLVLRSGIRNLSDGCSKRYARHAMLPKVVMNFDAYIVHALTGVRMPKPEKER